MFGSRGKKPPVPLAPSVPTTAAPPGPVAPGPATTPPATVPATPAPAAPAPPVPAAPAPAPKSKMQLLNEETRSRQESVKDSEVIGVHKLHKAFDNYKVGDETYFDDGSESSKLGKTATVGTEVLDKGSTITGMAKSSAKFAGEMAEKTLEKWSGGNGIVGAAVTFIKYIKEAYEIMTSDDSGKSKAAQLGKETAAAAMDMAGDIMDAIEGLGGTVLKGLKVIPGLGIVVDAIEIGISVYKIMKADRARVRMNDSRRLFKEKYLNAEVEMAPGGEKRKMVNTVGKYNIRRLWKKTDETVDESAMKKRREELLAKRKLDPATFTEQEQAELSDILSYSTQDRLRRVNRNKELENVGSIVIKLGSIAAKIAAMVGTFGASAAAESAAAGIELGLDAAGLVGDATKLTKSLYAERGGRDKGSQYTKYLLEIIGNLPNTYDKPEFKSRYAQATDMITATGVNTSKLYKQADSIEAMAAGDKKAGRGKAYKMFIELFDT